MTDRFFDQQVWHWAGPGACEDTYRGTGRTLVASKVSCGHCRATMQPEVQQRSGLYDQDEFTLSDKLTRVALAIASIGGAVAVVYIIKWLVAPLVAAL